MKISVIIPTYKPKAYLWECLDSLVAQTFPKQDFEVILVLNGCCEPWKGEIEQYIASRMQGMQVNFIHTDQGGVSNARNIALDQVRGEYVTFIDDDDYISPCYLEELYGCVSPNLVSVCKPLAFWEGKEGFIDYSITNVYNKYVQYGTVTSSKARKYFSGPCMKLIPMSFIQDRRFDIRFKNGEDSLFMFLISDKIKHVSFTSPSAVYFRRYREGSAMTSRRSRWSILKNSVRLIFAYSFIFFKSPLRYSFSYYFNNILGAINTIIVGF